ncbi:PilZ domain-containing protein [Myxococcota bacterium]|nr:PilZ domain-containing protein [Myxococcota bacterium]
MSLEPSTRRVNQRHDVDIPGTVQTKSAVREVRIQNISVGGLYIKDDFEYENKQIITVTFSIPHLDKDITVDSIVRWIERGNDSIEGIGVQFVGLKAKEVWALTRYLSSIQSMDV